ncbi:MAG: DUF4177 domain-containing protein [Spirochaetia bacterium]
MKQYKVLTQKDKFFSKRFDPLKIEEVLNTMAKDRWELKVGATADFKGGKRDELILILEKEN